MTLWWPRAEARAAEEVHRVGAGHQRAARRGVCKRVQGEFMRWPTCIAVGVPLRAYLVCTVSEPRVSPAICGPFFFIGILASDRSKRPPVLHKLRQDGAFAVG